GGFASCRINAAWALHRGLVSGRRRSGRGRYWPQAAPVYGLGRRLIRDDFCGSRRTGDPGGPVLTGDELLLGTLVSPVEREVAAHGLLRADPPGVGTSRRSEPIVEGQAHRVISHDRPRHGRPLSADAVHLRPDPPFLVLEHLRDCQVARSPEGATSKALARRA